MSKEILLIGTQPQQEVERQIGVVVELVLDGLGRRAATRCPGPRPDPGRSAEIGGLTAAFAG